MNAAGTVGWFARHEGRLAWRDWRMLLSGGRRRRGVTLLFGLACFVLFLHAMAYASLVRSTTLAGTPDRRLLVFITGTLALYFSLMLSQAMEAVTRAFYGRGDLDLILSSPAAAWRVFAVRIAAMAVTIMLMSLALAAPVIDMTAWLGGARWLAAYGVVAAMAMASVALAVALTALLFRLIGPKRTRLAAQIAAAVIGASFVIGVQFAAIVSYGTLSRIAFLQSDAMIQHAPAPDSILWWPARAAMGGWTALSAVIAAGTAALVVAIAAYASRFGTFALAAGGISQSPARQSRRRSPFRTASPAQALRRKEWTLLLRDPWLASQSLMQLLYLLPPVFLLYRSFYETGRASALLVPVLIMAAGQLAGGLAWLAISGEDAPELIASAPVTAARVLRAKTEAVLGAVAIVFSPFILVLAALDPVSALAIAAGILMAAGSSMLIQFWFRAQARRSQFRRRQTSSRIATIAEALSSIAWAGTGALAAAGNGAALVFGAGALVILAGTWALSPTPSRSER
jgi:ABC-2 type transport system permease protein